MERYHEDTQSRRGDEQLEAQEPKCEQRAKNTQDALTHIVHGASHSEHISDITKDDEGVIEGVRKRQCVHGGHDSNRGSTERESQPKIFF